MLNNNFQLEKHFNINQCTLPLATYFNARSTGYKNSGIVVFYEKK